MSIDDFQELLEARGCRRGAAAGSWTCPAHDDRTPSLSVSEGTGRRILVKCFAGCTVEQIVAALGLSLADLFAEVAPPATERTALQKAPPPEVLGEPASAQIAALKRTRRLRDGTTLDRVGAKLVSWQGQEWLAFPTIADGVWKCWALDRNGRPRFDEKGKWVRKNTGPVSLVISPALRERNGSAIPRLFDVEGESDLLAAVEAGLPYVVTGSGGASALAGHEAHREWLGGLHAGEVVVVRDLDKAGRDGVEKVAAWWLAQGVPVRVLDLPEALGAGGDLRDYLNGRAARGGVPASEPMGDAAALCTLADSAALREPEEPGIPGLVRLASVKPEQVEWLWPGRLPLGKVSILDGDPGLGKSTVTLDLAARVTTGQPLPDGSAGRLGGVVLTSAEDGLADTIVPRLQAAGADLERVRAFEATADHGLPTIPEGLGRIEAAIVEVGAVLVVIDPLMAVLGHDVNAHRDQDVRRALAPLAALAERKCAAVLVVRHLNKAAGSNALYRGGGSIGIAGAARSVLLVARDPDDESRRVLAHVKSNLGPLAPSLGFRLVADASSAAAAVEWTGPREVSAGALLAAPPDASERGAIDEACDFLREALAAGARPVREVQAEARAAGVHVATLRRARERLGVRVSKQGMKGGWAWRLPPEDAQAPLKMLNPETLSTFGPGEHLRSAPVAPPSASNAAGGPESTEPGNDEAEPELFK